MGYGTDLRVAIVYVFRIADTFQENVVLFVLLGIITTLYHLDTAYMGTMRYGRASQPSHILFFLYY